MSKVTLNLNPEIISEVTLVRDIRHLRPALVRTEQGKPIVLIKVYAPHGHDTYLALSAGAPRQWASNPDKYTFVRYLADDETVVIPGSNY